jgi:hypothetical protein
MAAAGARLAGLQLLPLLLVAAAVAVMTAGVEFQDLHRHQGLPLPPLMIGRMEQQQQRVAALARHPVTEMAQCSSSSGMVIGISSSSGQEGFRLRTPAAATAAAGVGTCSLGI